MFTLAVLLLLSLMGAAILLSTGSGPRFSDTVKEREAFLRAGSAVNIAAAVTRVILNPEMGDPRDFLAQALPYKVTLSDDFNLAFLLGEAENGADSQQYYLRAWGRPEGGRERGPQIFFWQGQELIATASVAVERLAPVPAGMSLAETGYDLSGESGSRLMILVTVNGQSLLADARGPEAAHSLISAIFREVE